MLRWLAYSAVLLVLFAVAIIVWRFDLLQRRPLSSTLPVIPALVAGKPAEPIEPVPLRIEVDPGKARLGARLFRDPVLSGDGSVACISCHVMERGGGDGLPLARPVGERAHERNTQSVFNVGLQTLFNWDGRYDSLQGQALGVLNDIMAVHWPRAIDALRRDVLYRRAFDRHYGGEISPDTVADALAVYQQTLVTPDARFDRYLRGDRSALNSEEKRGYAAFKRYGCIACHQGVNVGANMLATFGVMADYFADRGDVGEADLGYMKVTGDEQDRYRFKVPSLRNVALTAPYFHDGSVETLEEAVAKMAYYQLGMDLPRRDIEAIVAFLKTLTGRLPEPAPWEG